MGICSTLHPVFSSLLFHSSRLRVREYRNYLAILKLFGHSRYISQTLAESQIGRKLTKGENPRHNAQLKLQ